MTTAFFKTGRARVLVALLAAAALAGGVFLVISLRQEAPPEPGPEEVKPAPRPAPKTPPVVEVGVIASSPGSSAEEVERQVTIPLEVALAGIPKLRATRSLSAFGMSRLSLLFEEGSDLTGARTEVINRLNVVTLPPGVTPQVVAASAGAVLRYTLSSPRDAAGRNVYLPRDLLALQEEVLEREFRRVPRVVDVEGWGGAHKRYEVLLDPDRLRRYGVGLRQVQAALADGNANVGGDLLRGDVALRVRAVGLLGGGNSPLLEALAQKSPQAAAAHLRAEEARRLRDVRRAVVTKVNEVPVCVEDLVEGGRLAEGAPPDERGVVVGHTPRDSRVGRGRRQPDGSWADEDDLVEGAVLLRHGEDAQAARAAVNAKVRELGEPGRLLPGVRLEPFGEGEAVWALGFPPAGVTPERLAALARQARAIVGAFPEAEGVVSRAGDDPAGPDTVRLSVTLRRGARPELLKEMEAELSRKLVGIDWRLGPSPPDEAAELFAVAAGEHRVKIVGPDLAELERLAEQVRQALRQVLGVDGARVWPGAGRAALEVQLDPDKCRRWGVSAADVRAALRAGLDGLVCTQAVEGGTSFEAVLRWPPRLRDGPEALLDAPFDVVNDALQIGPAERPRLRLRDLVALPAQGVRPGAAAIYREDGRRAVVVLYRVKGRAPADVAAEAARRTEDLFRAPYRAEWDDR
jgi:Cu/Ag efflux pump CusA